CQQGYSYLTF
nr:immunoglobulin light chain junction region [Macaca mulatta]MOW14050.1 immunoglobulin light chain junction region [Macaca mulatta]